MLITSVFFLLFAWDSIVQENAFELLASMVLVGAVAARVFYYVVRSHQPCPLLIDSRILWCFVAKRLVRNGLVHLHDYLLEILGTCMGVGNRFIELYVFNFCLRVSLVYCKEVPVPVNHSRYPTTCVNKQEPN